MQIKKYIIYIRKHQTQIFKELVQKKKFLNGMTLPKHQIK